MARKTTSETVIQPRRTVGRDVNGQDFRLQKLQLQYVNASHATEKVRNCPAKNKSTFSCGPEVPTNLGN
jgi:hypothetical protein